MKILKTLSILATLAILLIPSISDAGWVNGYWKSDGTYVAGYWRSDPNGLKYDNYSFDGDWSDAFNDSYFSSDKDYSSDWYTPSWITQDDYYLGKSFYDSRNSYSSYDYNNFDYDYDFWDDPVYSYTPSYNYGSYWNNDLFDSYKSPSLDTYKSYSYPSYNSYDSYDSYDTYDSYKYPSYNSYDSYDSYKYPSYSSYDPYSSYSPSYGSYDDYDYLDNSWSSPSYGSSYDSIYDWNY